jgi:Flp pilus assembly pilin Flp
VTNDTKWIVGTSIAIITGIAGSAVAVIAVVVTLSGDVRADLRDVNARLDGFDARLRAVEVALGKVDQLLETLHRFHLPAPSAGE